jgi:ribosomal protein L7Ae-like RNA K-turn-binding protein
MGNTCQRRQSPELKNAMTTEASPFRAPPGLEKPSFRALRPDAQKFVPQSRWPVDEDADNNDEKEEWEMFLDKKKADMRNKQVNHLRQGRDGLYTSQYRDMLGSKGKAPWKKEERRDFDILKSWRSAAPVQSSAPNESGMKKRKPTPLKKQILAQRGDAPSNPLWDKFADHLQKFKDENQITPHTKQPTKDDIESSSTSIVPFGLAERHYMSDTEDSKKTHEHIEESHGPVREYVDMCLTPALESAVVALLFALRQLKMQDLGLGLKTRRYAVGFREVGRVLQQKTASALLIAPDVERTGGALEDKVLDLKSACEREGVPVIFALSRRQLGSAIQKNVTISVLAIQDLRGAEELFDTMIREAKLARA